MSSNKDRLCLAFYDRNGHKGFHIALLIHPKKSASRSPLSSPSTDAPYDVYDVTNTLTTEYPDARWRYRARHFDGPSEDKALVALVLMGKISSGKTADVIKIFESVPALPATPPAPDAPIWDCHKWVHNVIVTLQGEAGLVAGLDELPPWDALMADSDAYAIKKKEDYLKLRPFDFKARTMTVKKSTTKK